jgi:hypothetical protein
MKYFLKISNSAIKNQCNYNDIDRMVIVLSVFVLKLNNDRSLADRAVRQ